MVRSDATLGPQSFIYDLFVTTELDIVGLTANLTSPNGCLDPSVQNVPGSFYNAVDALGNPMGSVVNSPSPSDVERFPQLAADS